jgi:hypothetical protein
LTALAVAFAIACSLRVKDRPSTTGADVGIGAGAGAGAGGDAGSAMYNLRRAIATPAARAVTTNTLAGGSSIVVDMKNALQKRRKQLVCTD